MHSAKLAVAQEFLRDQRSNHLQCALAHATTWCVAPATDVLLGQNAKPRKSDQFWLKSLGAAAGEIELLKVDTFLNGFQLQRMPWKKEAVVEVINAARARPPIDVVAYIQDMAMKLSHATRPVRNGRRPARQTSAASKFSLFAHPQSRIYIWDQHALRSARVRYASMQKRGAEAVSPVHAIRSKDRAHNYAIFYDTCMRAQAHERIQDDFQTALNELMVFIDGVGGPMADRSFTPAEFVERRLLDKLMFVEGQELARLFKRERATTRKVV